MKILKIICLIISVISCVVNVIYLINETTTFLDRFYKKLGNYDDRKLEKYRNGLYNYSDITIEVLKRDEVFIFMMLKQSLTSFFISVCGAITFFCGAYNLAKTANYISIYMWSLIVIFLIMCPIFLVIFTKKAKTMDIREVYKYSSIRPVWFPIASSACMAFSVALNFAAVIGIIPIILGF